MHFLFVWCFWHSLGSRRFVRRWKNVLSPLSCSLILALLPERESYGIGIISRERERERAIFWQPLSSLLLYYDDNSHCPASHHAPPQHWSPNTTATSYVMVFYLGTIVPLKWSLLKKIGNASIRSSIRDWCVWCRWWSGIVMTIRWEGHSSLMTVWYINKSMHHKLSLLSTLYNIIISYPLQCLCLQLQSVACSKQSRKVVIVLASLSTENQHSFNHSSQAKIRIRGPRFPCSQYIIILDIVSWNKRKMIHSGEAICYSKKEEGCT